MSLAKSQKWTHVACEDREDAAAGVRAICSMASGTRSAKAYACDLEGVMTTIRVRDNDKKKKKENITPKFQPSTNPNIKNDQ